MAAPQTQTTLKDVARMSNLAVSTVSNILTGSPYSWAAKTTRQRVFETARALGYRPNRVARSLVRQKTELLAIMIPDQRNPVFAEISHGAITEAQKAGYQVLLCSTEERLDLEREYVIQLIEHRCDGFILMPVHGHSDGEVFAQLKQTRTPMVIIADPQPGVEADCINSDFEEGAYLATQHLAALGRRRIAFLGAAVAKGLTESRHRGWQRALAEAGLWEAAGRLAWFCGSDLESAYRKAREIFGKGAERPDAIVCLNDLAAIATCRAIDDCGLRVPEDVGVVGFDDIPMSRFLKVPLTTVRTEVEKIGRLAVRMLFERMRDPDKATETVRLKPQLVVRASCGETNFPWRCG